MTPELARHLNRDQTDAGAVPIPVAAPALAGNERRYVLEALDSTWISSSGRFIGEFERAFAESVGISHAIAVSSGTAALHAALLALGIGAGDEVIVPTLTYIASANAVSYCGATPVFVDSDPETGNLDPTLIEHVLTPRTKAVMVVHLYGHPVDTDPVTALAKAHGLAVVEDAAEAHGARYRGRRVGSLGDTAAFSFFGNKIVTTGEGGMVVTDDPEIAERVRIIRGQGQDPERRYRFPVIGFNYRMTNIAAAIGLAQMERFEWHLAQRRRNASWYAARLGDHPSLRLLEEPGYADSVFWLNGAVLSERCRVSRDEMIEGLARRQIETRPFFYPCHTMPPYATHARGRRFPNAERLAANGISLPSSALLTEEDVDRVCRAVVELADG